MRRNDYLLCLLVIVLALGGFLLLKQPPGTSHIVRISQNNQTVLEMPLASFPVSYTLQGTHGPMLISKNDAGLAIDSSPCPDKLCVRQGRITSGALICVPENIIIELRKAKEGGAHDALLR